MTTVNRQVYALEFSEEHWDEIDDLVECFDPPPLADGAGERGFPRPVWIAIGHMALGKARRVDEGVYDFDGEKDDEWVDDWVDDLESIAETILAEFQPGDGRI